MAAKKHDIPELLEALREGKGPLLLLLRGEEPYLLKEFKMAVRAAGEVVVEEELRKGGPEAPMLEHAQGISLFGGRNALWLKATSPSQWSAGAKKIWSELRGAAEDGHVRIVMRADGDRRVSWAALGAMTTVDIDETDTSFWLRRMNEARGKFLDDKKLTFLSGLEADLSQYDNWIELWRWGGDLWAERTLGWSPGARHAVRGEFDNPAFAWVDALLEGNRSAARRLLRENLDKGGEAIQLVALASKSARILATLDAGREVRNQPDFLVRKCSRFKGRGRGAQLVRGLAEADRLLKSSTADPESLLARL